jgi:hypothetical protein
MPAVHPGDEELPLFWRAVGDSAGAYTEFLQRYATGERRGAQQRVKGRLYQVRDRTLRHERELTRRLRNGYPDVELPVRTQWFLQAEPHHGFARGPKTDARRHWKVERCAKSEPSSGD